MRLRISLPDRGVDAGMALYDSAAPNVSAFVWAALERPLNTRTAHACFDGHEVFVIFQPTRDPPPPENISMRPSPGDVMYFHAPAGKFAAVTADDRLRGTTPDVHELAFIYGEVDLRHFWEEGWIGSIVGHVEEGFAAFAAACRETLVSGAVEIRVSQILLEPESTGR